MSILFSNCHFLWKLMPLVPYKDASTIFCLNRTVSNVIQYQVFNFETIQNLIIKREMRKVIQRYIFYSIGPYAVSQLGIKLYQMSFGLLKSMTNGEWTSIHKFIKSSWTFDRFVGGVRYNFAFVTRIGNFKLLKYLFQKVHIFI